jgi:parallel beta-helix repeat protein
MTKQNTQHLKILFQLGSAICALAFFLIAPSALAATYYVDTDSLGGTCSDSNPGTSLAAPWCTVQKAADTAVAGDVINIREGTYREVVTPANSGTAGNVITYQSYNSETPVISAAIEGAGWASLADEEDSSVGLFTDGFENGDSTFQNYNSGTGDTVGSGNTLTVATGTDNNGNYALRAAFGGTDRNARVATTLDTPSADVYQRMYFRINSGYNITANDTGQIIMNLRIDSGTSRGSVELLQNSSDQFYIRGRAVNPGTGSTGVLGTTPAGSIVPDTWYLLEYRYKGGDATTGGAELWLNGSSTGSVYTYNTSTTTIGRAEWGGGTSGTGVAASGSVLYIDDVKVATSSIGAFDAAGPANTYKMTNVTGDPNNIFEEGDRMATSSDYLSMSAGEYYYDSTNDILYVRTSDSSDPSTKTIDIPFWNEGFLIVGKQYLLFDDLTVRYNDGAGGLDGAFVIATSSYITVQNSTIEDNFGVGVYLHRASSSTISDNEILRNQRDFGGGLRLENGSDHNDILDNTITGLGVEAGNGINFCGDETCGNTGNNYNTISGNTFYNLRDSCVYIGSRSDYNVFEKNSCGLTYRANGVGGTGLHVSRGSDYNIVRNNIFFDTYGASVVIQSNTIESVEVPVYGNQVLNNVIYNAATAVSGNHGGISVLDEAYDTEIKNNIIYQAHDVSGLRVTGAAATSTVTDYNLYYSTQGTSDEMFHWGVTSGTFYTDLTEFRTAFPTQEINSVSVDPEFVDASAHDFTLATTSPAIDAGETHADVADDYLGVSRPQGVAYDFGAYEWVSGDAASPVISSISSNTPGQTSVTITWTTNEASDSQINYGLSSTYTASTTLDTADTTSHSVTISGLTANTTYHFRVRSTDSSGNLGLSSDQTFTTAAASSGGGGGSSSGGSRRSSTEEEASVEEPANALSATSGTALVLSAQLGPKSIGDQVSVLQKMLALDPLVYPEGEITGFYGVLTQKAVERFQVKYGIITSGTPLTTGFGAVGPKTLAKLNEVFGNKGVGPAIADAAKQEKINQLLSLLAKLQQLLALLKAQESI